MKKTIFRGVGTALITPFKEGKIDYNSLEKIIEMQISAGIDALIVGGTTAEIATLSEVERHSLYVFCKEKCANRTKLVFGTGTNDTASAVKYTEMAEKIGCDGVLLVTPYYNKGTEEGVFRHYTEILNSTSLPAILYNVPSRTGVNLGLGLLSRLAEDEKVVGIKEASDSADRLVSISAYGSELPLYAGNDSQIYTCLSLGGEGVISVISNLLPKETVEIARLFDEGKRKEALARQQRLLPLINALFLETNPAPVKWAMQEMNLCSAEVRLPLYFPRESTVYALRQELGRITKSN